MEREEEEKKARKERLGEEDIERGEEVKERKERHSGVSESRNRQQEKRK